MGTGFVWRQEGALEMESENPGAVTSSVGSPPESLDEMIDRHGHEGRVVGGHAGRGEPAGDADVVVDSGVYEIHTAVTVYVDIDEAGDGDGRGVRRLEPDCRDDAALHSDVAPQELTVDNGCAYS